MRIVLGRDIAGAWPLLRDSGAYTGFSRFSEDVRSGRAIVVRSEDDPGAVAAVTRWRGHLPIGWIKAFSGGRRSGEFAAELGNYLLECGFEAALSPLLRRGAAVCFKRAGYREKESIAFMALKRLAPADERGPAEILPLAEGQEMSALIVDEASFDEFWRLAMDDLVEILEGSSSFAAVLDGHIVGYNIVRVDAGRGMLARLAVHPSARRLGIGRQLVCRAINWFADVGVSTAALTTQLDNGAARSLYESLGFRKVDELSLLWFRGEGRCSEPTRESSYFT